MKTERIERRKCLSNIEIEIIEQYKGIKIILLCNTLSEKFPTEIFGKLGLTQQIVEQKRTMEMGKESRWRLHANKTDVFQKTTKNALQNWGTTQKIKKTWLQRTQVKPDLELPFGKYKTTETINRLHSVADIWTISKRTIPSVNLNYWQ